MRKHCVPIGLLRRDPRRYRFPLPNAVWEYDLKPIEFMILSYLCYCHSHSRNDEKVCAEAVAKAVHLTVDTVKSSGAFPHRSVHFCPQCRQFPRSAAGAFMAKLKGS